MCVIFSPAYDLVLVKVSHNNIITFEDLVDDDNDYYKGDLVLLYFICWHRDYVDKSRGNDVISNTLEAAGVWDFFQHSLGYNIIPFFFYLIEYFLRQSVTF